MGFLTKFTAWKWVGVTGSRLNLPPLTPSSVASCGQRQLGVSQWTILVALLKSLIYTHTHTHIHKHIHTNSSRYTSGRGL